MTRTGTFTTGSGRRQAGYTLLELLVVLAIFAVVLALAMPLLTRGSGSADMQSAVRDVAAGLRYARSEAIRQNREIPVVFDLEKRSFMVGNEHEHRIPEKLRLSLYTAKSELVSNRVANVRFYPDGSSTGGRLRVAVSDSERFADVKVDWLSGRVEVVP